MAFIVDKKMESERLILELKGNVDEDANFHLPDIGGTQTVVLDLEGIAAINSVGIRAWLKWIKNFSHVSLIVRKCPKVIVDQFNMVAGFLPPETKIQSFYVPYYSEVSGVTKAVLFEQGIDFKDGRVFLPKEVKDSSGEIMEIDVTEAKYFQFIKNG